MRHSTSRTLYDYWNNLRGKRKAPTRREINPHDIRQDLSNVFILECHDPLTYRFRLAGTQVCEILGQEMRGRNLLDIWSRRERESIESLLYSVVEDSAAAILGVEVRTDLNETATMELLFLPLTADDRTTTRILGAASFKEKPHWLGATPATQFSIKSLRLLWPDHAPRFIVDSDTSKPVFDPPYADKMPARRRNHLRLIEGGLNNR